MKLVNLAKVSLGLMLAWGTVAQAEVAGRVLVAVGDTSVERAGKEIRLAAGAAVETGDTLRVGEASNMQVRFTDEAIMALRPNSTVRIDDYSFIKKADSDKSIFSLLKGGLRTITGIIGRSSRKNYAVKAATATIGIRGTHFTLVHCANDCRNADGSQADNGTFGGVTDGRIEVRNNAGEREFGQNEFFFVASRDALPAGLIAPPPFLRDRLEGQVKSKGKDKVAGAGGSESAETSTNTSTTTQPVLATPPLIATTLPFSPDPAVTQSVLVSWVDVWGWVSGSYWGIQAESSGDFGEQISTAEFNAVTSFLAPYQQGFSAAAGNVHWGMVPFAGETGDHWAYGDPMGALPTAGIFTFNHIGGTVPTNNEGAAGGINSASPIVVNFGAQTVVGSMNYWVPAPLSVGGGNVTYSININATTGAGAGTSTFSCSHGSGYCTNLGISVSGTGFGATLSGLAMGVATAATVGVSAVPQATATVQVYQRPY